MSSNRPGSAGTGLDPGGAARMVGPRMRWTPQILGAGPGFPDPREAPRHGPWAGCVAVGGDFSVRRLVEAYRGGLFPWSDDPPTWWSPDPRGIIELEGFRVSRSLRRVLRAGRFAVTVNAAFRRVMEGCAAPARGRWRTWISRAFIEGYASLHEAGHAHSLECWLGGELVGGIYGVAVGGVFAGESMFHRVDDASKVALAALVARLREREFGLLDVQMLTPITRQLGGIEISREEYLMRLAEVRDLDRRFV